MISDPLTRWSEREEDRMAVKRDHDVKRQERARQSLKTLKGEAEEISSTTAYKYSEAGTRV